MTSIRVPRKRRLLTLCAALAVSAGAAATALAVLPGDREVTVGSNDLVFSQNKQNEPTVAVDPADSLRVAAGANDNIDLESCNAGDPTRCPFTTGVGLTGFQGSLDGGDSWLQPTYQGFTARHCVVPPGGPCSPMQGPIGTVPFYFESGLASGGDPVVAWGPKPGPNGTFSYANGSRLYVSNLASNFSALREEQQFRGFEAIAVSRTDDFASAATGNQAAWMPPVIASKQSETTFSDKETIWADNAASSPFFGNVYVCYVSFRSVGGPPEPARVIRSTDGGATWRDQQQLTPASNTRLGDGRQGCTVRTDSDGVVYVFFLAGDTPKSSPPGFDLVQFMTRSFDGGRSFEKAQPVARVRECGLPDPVSGRRTFDGVAGARTNSFPSVDIANGAPLGNGPDTIVLTWCDGPTPTERALVQYSVDKGLTWSTPVNGAASGDRPDFPAIAISPDGEDVWLTYMSFTGPWQTTTAAPRPFQGVVRHTDFPAVGAFADAHRGASGDARGSSANSLATEFLGDYNAVSATNAFAVSVFTDVRNATDCPAVDAYRQSLVAGSPIPRPAPNVTCPPTFGNTDVFGTSLADPTP